MKSPTDLAAARRRRAAEDLHEAIVVTRRDVHTSVDRLFDARERFAATAQLDVPPANDAPRIVGVADAAAYLHIGETALRDLVAQSQVPCIRIPSTRGSRPIMRFDLDDLDQYLTSRKQSA